MTYSVVRILESSQVEKSQSHRMQLHAVNIKRNIFISPLSVSIKKNIYFDIIKIKRRSATVIHFPGALHVAGAITSLFFFTSRHYICRHTSPLFDTRDEAAIFATRSINNRY